MKQKRQLLVVGFILIAAILWPIIANLSGRLKGESRTIEVRAGDLFEIALEENPSTGYSWVYEIEDASVAKIESDDYIASESGALGAKGKRKFILRAVSEGTCEIVFKYVRSWEDKEPESTVRYVIKVR